MGIGKYHWTGYGFCGAPLGSYPINRQLVYLKLCIVLAKAYSLEEDTLASSMSINHIRLRTFS